jgi:hypothetical protein
MKIISTCKNPVKLGATIVVPNVTTEISKKDLENFLKNDYGKSMSDLFFKKVATKRGRKSDS